MDKKDEIISMQLDLIRSMTENNMRRVGTDLWESGRAAKPAPEVKNGTSGGGNSAEGGYSRS